MMRIETVAEVGPDRQVVITLPPEVAEGAHRFVVLVDEPQRVRHADDVLPAEEPLEWDDGLLVYTGELADDPIQVLEEMRLERERRFLSGSTDESPL